jgi:hypothetical protein
LATLGAAAGALALASLLPLAADTTATRLSNLALEESGLAEAFVVLIESEPGKCFLVDRRDSTIRRSAQNEPGRKRNCTPFRGPAATLESWFLQSKNAATTFLVPVDEIEDWAYPLVYRFVRQQYTTLNLPRVEWVQMYVSRHYQGLYLQVDLPFDTRKRDGGSGIRRELLTVRGDELSRVDTRVQDYGEAYRASVVKGEVPAFDRPAPILGWLARRSPTGGVTMLMTSEPPYRLSLLPLPISLPRLYESMYGRVPDTAVDERYGKLVDEWSQSPPEAPFTPAERDAFDAQFRSAAASFVKGLQLHATLHRTTQSLMSELPKRLEGGADLALNLARF